MTYWGFHLAFILPVIGALLLIYRRTAGPRPPRAVLGFGLIAGMALLYTAPWDNYLIARGVWSYSPDRVSESLRLGLVPLEECCFFILQPVLTGLCLLCLLRQNGERVWLGPLPRMWLPRIVAGTLALLIGGAGVLAIVAGGHRLYVGLILVWVAPPLALHWFYGGYTLWQSRRVLGTSLAAATIYLWDRGPGGDWLENLERFPAVRDRVEPAGFTGGRSRVLPRDKPAGAPGAAALLPVDCVAADSFPRMKSKETMWPWRRPSQRWPGG